MIFDVVKRSLASPKCVIPLEALLHDGRGSRMPDVQPGLLTAALADRVVAACSTTALAMEKSEEQTHLRLNTGNASVADGVLRPARVSFSRPSGLSVVASAKRT